MVCTDQGEFATYVSRRGALPDILMDQYGSDITKEDQNSFLPENAKRWEEMDWIQMDVRENTLRGDPYSGLLLFH